MGETMVAPPMPEEPPAGSFLSRFLGVFISPGETFEDIARKPGFIAPLATVFVAAWILVDTMSGWWKRGTNWKRVEGGMRFPRRLKKWPR